MVAGLKSLVLTIVIRSLELVAAVIARWESRKKGRRRGALTNVTIEKLVSNLGEDVADLRGAALRVENGIGEISDRVAEGQLLEAAEKATACRTIADDLVDWHRRVVEGGNA
jgi:hypothetical protein